jgi:hypothetical protein
MRFSFDEKKWNPEAVLEYWQSVHGALDIRWEQEFLTNPIVREICDHHPMHIQNAIRRKKKLEFALKYIFEVELENEFAAEALLDENRPNHAIGITNAHHGDRTTDPFDTGREDLLFKCQSCNLNLSRALISMETTSLKICTDCSTKLGQ